uniref:Uncharacterized protein n=1 Tax=Romanomermis culicivorax TaxID=13658 RepID=A0A915I8P4_ROMCU
MCKEGKYEESVITSSIARLESPNWEFVQLGIAHLGIAYLRVAHLGIDLFKNIFSVAYFEIIDLVRQRLRRNSARCIDHSRTDGEYFISKPFDYTAC